MILSFVALRSPPDNPAPASLATSSDFQLQLAEAASGPDQSGRTVAIAKEFVDDERFVGSPGALRRGTELLALHAALDDGSSRTMEQIATLVQAAIGDDVGAPDGDRLKDSVLAAYLLEPDGPSASVAVKLLRAYRIAEVVLAGGATVVQVEVLLRAPMVLPDYLLAMQHRAADAETGRPAHAPSPQSPDDIADTLLQEFRAVHDHHAKLSEALAEIASHDEDELVLSELDERRPLAELYRIRPGDVVRSSGTGVDERNQGKPEPAHALVRTSPLRRAAARSNVFLSDTAVRLLSEPAVQALRSLSLEPATTSVRDLQSKLAADHQQAGQQLRELTIDLGTRLSLVGKEKAAIIGAAIGDWKVDPVDDPSVVEPVTSGPPTTFTAVKPLGVADLCVVRTHIVRYERAEVASLENVLPGERLTHKIDRLEESESTDTTQSEQTSVATLAQTTAEQNNGKTTAQAVGAGRGPLTSDGPEAFSKSVTDVVSSTLTKRNLTSSVLRQLRRNEDDVEHLLDNTMSSSPRFGVYQWLDRVYQAQVFSYGSRLLYDLIVPEPAALFREALSRGRGHSALPPKPAKFTVAADKLTALNWSYYATGHHASGVEPPPATQVIVTENFGGKAPDPFSGELNANTLEFAESRSTRVPKGFKATSYRMIAMASGWTSYVLRVVVGAKQIAIDSDWSGKVFSGKLDGEVESLPVALIADGNGLNPGLSTLAVAIEIICEPTADAIAAWQTKTYAQILAGNQQRFADYEEQVANRDATARLRLQALDTDRQRAIIRDELKRSTLAVLTNQNFSTFNAMRIDSLGLPYPDAAATVALSAYIRFFELAVEWQHIEYAFFPYFWGSRSSWVSKVLGAEPDPQFAGFLTSGAARIVLPIRPGYEIAFEKFLNTGKTPTTPELLDVGGPFWASLITQLRDQAESDDSETTVGKPWEYRLASDLVRARRDEQLPKWTLTAGKWVEGPDADS